MGTFCDLTLNETAITSWKNDVPEEWFYLFSDKNIKHRVVKLYEEFPEEYSEDDSPDDYHIYKLSCSVKEAKKRLDIQGFNKENLIKDLQNNLNEQKQDYQSWIDSLGSSDDGFTLFIQNQINVIEGFNFDTWVKKIRELLRQKLKFPLDNTVDFLKRDPFYNYLLENYEADYMVNLPISDWRFFLRFILEAAKENDILTLDLTEMIDAGWYSIPFTTPIEQARNDLTSSYTNNTRIIILTEGHSDFDILSKSMNLLCPEFSDLYYFMDFNDDIRHPGGAPELIKRIKALISIKIQSKVIAIFDNDTAAHEALITLKGKPIPENIKLCLLPGFDELRSYPTIGPQGQHNSDINGRAASIEMYLGHDCLTDENGQMIPVEWSGKSSTISTYQGEIKEKNYIKNKFYKKIEHCVKNKASISNYDWTGIELILEHIFNQFQD